MSTLSPENIKAPYKVHFVDSLKMACGFKKLNDFLSYLRGIADFIYYAFVLFDY